MKHIIVISDTHIGSRLGLCPPEVKLDNGGYYKASKMQIKLWNMWKEMCNKIIPKLTRRNKYIVVHNGDLFEGTNRKSNNLISDNTEDQKRAGIKLMRMLVNDRCEEYYQIRGTEFHSETSGQAEEDIAYILHSKKVNGEHSYYELNLKVENILINFSHHTSVVSSGMTETNALLRELSETMLDCGKNNRKRPDMIVRSHRHRYSKVEVPTNYGIAIALSTPGWQLKTPYSYKYSIARNAIPHFGAVLISVDKSKVYVEPIIWYISQ